MSQELRLLGWELGRMFCAVLGDAGAERVVVWARLRFVCRGPSAGHPRPARSRADLSPRSAATRRGQPLVCMHRKHGFGSLRLLFGAVWLLLLEVCLVLARPPFVPVPISLVLRPISLELRPPWLVLDSRWLVLGSVQHMCLWDVCAPALCKHAFYRPCRVCSLRPCARAHARKAKGRTKRE